MPKTNILVETKWLQVETKWMPVDAEWRLFKL